jgi:hypothetical protein
LCAGGGILTSGGWNVLRLAEGSKGSLGDRFCAENADCPHPSPLPEYRAREKKGTSDCTERERIE